MRSVVILGLALAVSSAFGCGDDSESPSGGGDTGGGAIGGGGEGGALGGGGAGGGPLDCTDPDTTTDAPCGSLSMATSDVTSRRRNHHTTLLAELPSGTFLYAIGGANVASTLDEVDRFAIHDDGSLEASVSLPPIPVAEGGGTGALVGRTIVVAGGMTDTGTTDASFYAIVGDDGGITKWEDGGDVLARRMHPGAVAMDETIWVLGGFDDPDVWDDIVSAKVAADGTLGSWAPAGTLPGKRSHFGVTRVGSDVYLTGGLEASALDNPPFLKDTWHGRILDDGTIGAWEQGPDLPLGLATHASFFYGGYLYVGGGIGEPAHQEDHIWRAAIQADRTLGAWEELPVTFSVPRGHVHNLPVFKNHFYSVAGAVNFSLQSTDAIDIGTFE